MDLNNINVPSIIHTKKRLCRKLPAPEKIFDIDTTITKVCKECGCDHGDNIPVKKGDPINIDITDEDLKEYENGDEYLYIYRECQKCKNLRDPTVTLKYPVYRLGKPCIKCKREYYKPIYHSGTRTKYSICALCYGLD